MKRLTLKEVYFKNILKEGGLEAYPDTVSLESFPDNIIENLARQLKATDIIAGINNDEVRIGLIEELDKMQVHTMRNLNNERLLKAAQKVFNNLRFEPNFYSIQKDDPTADVWNPIEQYNKRYTREEGV